VEERVRDFISRINDTDKANLLTARGEGGNGQHMQAFPELGVPAYYWGKNCLHSAPTAKCVNNSKGEEHCPVNFPSGPSWGATFDRALMQDMAQVVGTELRAAFILGNNEGALDCWGPVVNLNRHSLMHT